MLLLTKITWVVRLLVDNYRFKKLDLASIIHVTTTLLRICEDPGRISRLSPAADGGNWGSVERNKEGDGKTDESSDYFLFFREALFSIRPRLDCLIFPTPVNVYTCNLQVSNRIHGMSNDWIWPLGLRGTSRRLLAPSPRRDQGYRLAAAGA